jgi:hypothetical protein
MPRGSLATLDASRRVLDPLLMQFECCKLVEGEYYRVICAFQDRISVGELIAGTLALLLLYCGACARHPVSNLGYPSVKPLASNVDVESRDNHSTMLFVLELALRSRLTAVNRKSAIQRLKKINGRAYRDNDEKVVEISGKLRCRWRRRVGILQTGMLMLLLALQSSDCRFCLMPLCITNRYSPPRQRHSNLTGDI